MNYRRHIYLFVTVLNSMFASVACGTGQGGQGGTAEEPCSPGTPPSCDDSQTEIRCMGDPPSPVKNSCQGDNQVCKPGVGCTCVLSECVIGAKPGCFGVQAVSVCEHVGTCEQWVQAPGPTCAQKNMVCQDGECINQCTGTNQLWANECDPDPALPACGVLVCDTDAGTLVPDHLNCLLGAVACSKNEECASCKCLNNICIGDTPLHCPIAANCP